MPPNGGTTGEWVVFPSSFQVFRDGLICAPIYDASFFLTEVRSQELDGLSLKRTSAKLSSVC